MSGNGLAHTDTFEQKNQLVVEVVAVHWRHSVRVVLYYRPIFLIQTCKRTLGARCYSFPAGFFFQEERIPLRA